MAVEQDKGFLGRWSARKVAVKEGKPVAESVPQRHLDTLNVNGSLSMPVTATLRTEPASAPPVLTLDDVAELTPASDFSTFVAKGVDSLVKNAAMKKLFADPHYNIMDGLDIYIGDYSTHAPMPQSVIDEITKDGFLNMFQKEEVPIEKAPAHDDADLQLQRDNATRSEVDIGSPRPCAEDSAESTSPQPAVPPPST